MNENEQLGSYRILRRIAISSMSEVYLATSGPGPFAGRPVVVKLLLEDVAGIQQFRNLFENEARLSSVMDHPNIVKFLDFGESGGRPFLVMEHVEGLDLWRLLRRLKRAGYGLPPAQGVYVVLEIAKALEYLHSRSDETGRQLHIIHRDVSPSNILLGMDSEVKLGDFGIAYSEQLNVASFGRKFKGKVHYMSPEQVRGDPVDHRSDLYSAGVVLAELMLGRKPFDGASDLSILINVRDRHSPVLDEGLRTLPPALSEVIECALASSPDARFPDASAFRKGLEACLDRKGKSEAVLGLAASMRAATRRQDSPDAQARRKSPGSSFNLVQALAMSSPPGEDGTKPGSQPPAGPDLQLDQDDERATAQATPARSSMHYVVKRMEGQVLGSLPLSEIIQGIVCGRIGEEDLVSVNGASFSAVSTIPELSKHLPSVTPTEKRHDLGLPDKRGILSENTVVKVLLDLYRDRETGLLMFECSGIRKDVHLENGVPCYVSSNLAKELLGEFLVQEGIISRMELDMALAVMDKFEGRPGDTLLGLDILDSITLIRAITKQIKARFHDVFAWTNGEYHFYRDARCSRENFRLTAPALELIREGCMHALEQEDAEAWYRANEFVTLGLVPGPEFPLDDWHLSMSFATLIGGLSKPSTLAQVMKPYEHASTDVRGRLLRVLMFGVQVGLLEWAIAGRSE